MGLWATRFLVSIDEMIHDQLPIRPVNKIASFSTFALFFLFVQPTIKAASWTCSSAKVAKKAVEFIHSDDQIVIYHAYLSSLPFYLQVERPIWVVWSGHKDHVMRSFYVAKKRPPAAGAYDQILFTYDEFSKLWKESSRRLFVFLRKKDLPRLSKQRVRLTRSFLQVGRVILTSNE